MKQSLSLSQFLPYRCNNLGERISASLSRIYVDRFGITISEWRILATLAEYGQLQARQISRKTHMDKVRVSRAVASLQARDLLARQTCERDSRAANISLTAAGNTLFGQIAPEALAWEQKLLQPLEKSERQTLFSLLDKLELQLDTLAETTPL